MSSASPVSIQFPADINGLSEVGIAAGVDDLSEVAYWLRVATKPGAQRTPAHVAAGLLPEIKDLADAYDASTVEDIQVTEDTFRRAVDPANALSVYKAWAKQHLKMKVGQFVTKAKGPQIPIARFAPPEVDLDKTMAINPCPVTDEDAAAIWNTCIAVVVGNGWFPTNSKYVTILTPQDSKAAPRVRTNEAINASGFAGVKQVATMIAAMKVTWWLTNHHVGQQVEHIQSFAGKTYRAFEFAGSEQTNRMIFWAAGKWTSTISFMRAFDIGGLKAESNDDSYHKITVTGSVDVKMRMASRPAGTADQMTHLAIYDHCARSVFAVLVPPVNDVRALRQAKTDVRLNPASYHMGAKFLTGRPRVVLDPVADETRENLAGYIHAAAPGGTLAKASVIMNATTVAGNMVYQSIMSVKSRLALTASDAASLALVARMRGGGSGSNVASVEGKLTEEAQREIVRVAEEEARAKRARAAAGPVASGPGDADIGSA